MGSNNNTGAVIIVGGGGAATTAAQGSNYFGFGLAAGTDGVSTGPRIYAGTGNPNGALTAIPGSMFLSVDGGGGGLGTWFKCTAAPSTWVDIT